MLFPHLLPIMLFALLYSVRCDLSMNHGKDAIPHRITGSRCKYSHQYDNKIYLCKV